MKIGRNEPCPCGSGKKYKHCCLGKDENAHQNTLKMREEWSRAWFDDNIREAWYEDWSLETPLSDSETEEEFFDDEEEDWEDEREESDEALADTLATEAEEAEEKFWTDFTAQALAGKIALFEKKLEAPEVFQPTTAQEMLEHIFEAAAIADAREGYDTLIEKVRQAAPNIYSFAALSHLPHRITNALITKREENLLNLVEELAVFAAEAPIAFEITLTELCFYGRLDLFRAALKTAWPKFKPHDELEDEVSDIFASLAVRAAVFEYVERKRDDAEALFQTLAQFSNIPRARVEHFMGLLSGEQRPAWRVSDFEIKPSASRPRINDDLEEAPPLRATVAQNLFRLVLQFQGYLLREREVSLIKSDLGCHLLMHYMIQRALGHLHIPADFFIKHGEFAAQYQFRHLDWPRHVRLLCPDRVTLKHYLIEELRGDDSQHYSTACLFALVPQWLDFLVTQQLLEPAQRNQTLLDLFEVHEDLYGTLLQYTRNLHLAKSLIGWPWQQTRPPQI